MNRRTLMLVGCLVSTLAGLAHAAGKAPSHLGELYPQRVVLANVDKYPSQVKINGKRRNIYGGMGLDFDGRSTEPLIDANKR